MLYSLLLLLFIHLLFVCIVYLFITIGQMAHMPRPLRVLLVPTLTCMRQASLKRYIYIYICIHTLYIYIYLYMHIWSPRRVPKDLDAGQSRLGKMGSNGGRAEGLHREHPEVYIYIYIFIYLFIYLYLYI